MQNKTKAPRTLVKTKSKSARFVILFSILVISFLFFGCIKKSEPLSSYLSTEQISYLEEKYTSVNNCTVFICKYESSVLSIFNDIKSIFTGISYPNLKSCEFKNIDLENENDKNYIDSLTGKHGLSTSSSEFINLFMIGAGDSFFAGDEMFARCNGNLGINLIDISSLPKAINENIVKKRFLNAHSCMLNSGTIPFYKYGKIDADPSVLGTLLDGKGPLFISPGYGYNKSKFDPLIIPPTVAFQSIKQNCKNCIVTATVNYGDFETLNYYKSSSLVWNNIDVIAFIVNTSSFSTCEPLIIIQNKTNSLKSFAQNITETCGKPVVIIIHSEEGNNINGKCKWTNSDIARFYDYLIRSIPDLVSSGVIGVVAPDISQLSNEQIKSLGFFCTIFYSQSGSANSFTSYNIYSIKGDKPSLCNEYNNPTSMFALYEVKNYSNLPVLNTKKQESCSSKLFYNLDVGGGIFAKDNCDKNKTFILNIASKYFIDPSLYMAVLQKLGYYQSGQLQQYEKHCGTKCDLYKSNEQKDLCCLAETMAYYQNKTINKKSSIDDMFLAYFITYGTIKGESSYNQEFSKYSPSASMEEKKTVSLSLEASSDRKSLHMQTSVCNIYSTLCKEYNDIYYCMLYDQNCKDQTPTIPEEPIGPTPPGTPETPQPPSGGEQPTPSPTIPSYDFDQSILQVLKDAVAARAVCAMS